MKRVKTMMYVVGLGYLGLHLGTAVPALADGCSNRTLRGTYVFSQDGWENRPSTTTPPGDRRPFAYAGVETYDGRGNFTGINTLAIARNLTSTFPPTEVALFVTYSGTYSVNSNCTVEWTSTDQDGFVSNYHLFLSPDGDKFTFIGIDETQGVGQGVAHRGSR